MNYSEFVHSRFKDGTRIIGDMQGMNSAAMDRLHAAIGMVGEVRELRDSTGRKNTIEELGDLLFYLQAYANTLNRDIGYKKVEGLHTMQRGGQIDAIDKLAHTLLDLAKKEAIYCKSFDESNVSQIVDALWFSVCLFAGDCLGMHITDIMDTNRDKLEKRYPTGYSNAAAQARADKAGE